VGSDHQERARVRSRIGKLILEFCGYNPTFFMQELTSFVERRVGGHLAPDSPGRILRQLRQQKLLNYTVVSRRQSLYRIVPLKRPAEQAELFVRAG
jgi:hypothetical protein